MPRSLLRRAVGRVRRPRVGVVAVLSGEPAAERRLRRTVEEQQDVDVELVTVGSPAERRAAVAGLRAPRVVVLTDDVQLQPRALRLLADAGPVVIGRMGGGALAPPLLPRMLLDRERLLAELRDDDDRDGVLTTLRLLRGEHTEIPETVVSGIAPGQRRALWLSDPWATLDESLRVHATGRGLALDPDAFDLGWLWRDAAVLVEAGESATDEQWQRLVEALDGLDLTGLPVVKRAELWLAGHGSRQEVTDLVAAHRFTTEVAAHVVEGRVVADVPPLPPELSEMTDDETRLDTLLTRVRRRGDRVELEVFAGVRHVEQSDPGGVSAALVVGAREFPARVDLDPAVTRWFAERCHGHDAGRLSASVPADVTGPLQVRLRVGEVYREGPVSATDDLGSAGRLQAAPDGVRLERWDDPADGITDLRVTGEEVVVTGVSGDIVLISDDAELPGVEESPGVWRFRLAVDRWGLGERPAPTGRYALLVDGERARPSSALLDRLPEETRTPRHRATTRVRGGNLVLRLDPPLADDEAGPRRQALLQRAYAEVTEPLDPRLVYVQSFTGQAANDHPLAIHQELARRGADLDVRWLVADSHPAAPAGATPVQHRSREWYDVLARAGHVVTNIDLERWFRRREGQRVLQTYHGYPSKRMGLEQWRARGFPPSRIAQDLARSSGTWTALLTPQPDADRYYREQYAYDGRILALGYPRDDVLVGPDADRVRSEARDRLGLGDRRALLYAPTWRDDLATDFRRAEAEHHLDLEVLLDGLGEDWVVLFRGHRFHLVGRSAGRVLELTAYPDVNDLILAADAAVLDYSSLRFDFALTGRPAVYLVPDLERYTGTVRGFLQDYRTTAPGPLVDTTAEVVEQLRDYDRLVDSTRDRIDSFNQRFNSLADGHAAERVVEAFFADLLSDGG